MDNRAIGIFDSGVGGLTVLWEIMKAIPNESTIYFGDTKRFPYGPRDLDEVKKLVFKITRFLYDKDVKLIVIACNTSTAAALDDLKRQYDIPIIGVIEPGARTAVYNTRNKRVGVIATEGTVKSNAYPNEIERINPGIKTFSVPAPLLVDFVEKGILKGSGLDKVIKGYLKPLYDAGIDVLILGCTHFPLIEKRILACSGNGIKVISSAVETAKDVREILEERGLCADKGKTPERFFYETGIKSKFFEVGNMFLGEEIKEVIKIKLDI
ncbi:MAG: glutamate racemase [Actinomycetota bacterium]|nr:glutamate racemase [Actinomycetota bacterium]